MNLPKPLILVLSLLTSNVSSAAVFTNASDFFANAGTLNVESFETLPVTNLFDSSTLSLPGFEMTTTAAMGVFSGLPGNGTHPTDGDTFVHHFLSGRESFTVTFTFVNAITAFGLTTTDWVELPTSGADLYTMTTSAGDHLSISGFPELENGAEIFSGIVNSAGFTSVSLSGPQQGDAFGIDGVYYGPVPLPSAAWLLGSALIGLMGVARRKKA